MPRSRLLPVLVSLALLSACGGGDSPGPTDPQDTSPASIEITAGNQQMAAGGAAVSIAPTVRVRDGDGLPVSGATVTFAVEAGGGTIAGANATTNSAGIATAGPWTLGLSGDQRLSARVGSVAPVAFEATITPGTEQFVSVMGTGGGAFEIDEPGHPFEGFELVVPSGTFDGAVEWRFRAKDAPAGLALPNGYEIQGPALEVQTNAGRGDALVTIRVPVSRGPDHDVVIALYDAARDVIEVLPTVARSESWIEVVTTHLNATLLLGPAVGGATPPGASGSGRQSIQVGGSDGQLIRIEQLIPLAPTAGFLDTWPVFDYGSAQFPNGHGAAIPAFQALASASGGTVLSGVVRGLKTPGFYADAGPLAAVQLAHDRVSQQAEATAAAIKARLNALPKAERDEIVNRNIAASIAASGQSALMAVETASGALRVVAAVAGSENGVVARTVASAQEVQLPRSPAQGFVGGDIVVVGGEDAVTVQEIYPLSASWIVTESVQDLWDEIRPLGEGVSDAVRAQINESLGAQAGLEGLDLEVQYVADEEWMAVEEGDEVVVWSEESRLRNSMAAARAINVHLLADGRQMAGPAIEESFSVAVVLAAVGATSGVSTAVAVSPVVSDGVRVLQAGVSHRRLRSAKFEIEPKVVTLEAVEEMVELAASLDFEPPGGYRILWDWGDGEKSENLGIPTASHTYAEEGVYEVTASLLTDDDLGPTLSRQTAMVTVSGSGVWHAYTAQREFGLSTTAPASLLAFRDIVVSALISDMFLIARPIGGGSENVVLILVARGTGATLEEPPVAAGPGGFELVVGNVPEGTLAAGGPVTGSGAFAFQGAGHTFEFTASLEGGELTGDWTTRSDLVDEFNNPLFFILKWKFSARRFTPPDLEEKKRKGS